MTSTHSHARASSRILMPAAAALASLLSLPASAHVTLATTEAAPNSYYRGTLRIPHGCDGAATTTVRVQIPEGVIGVKPMPKSGWTLTTQKGAYAKTYQDHGKAVTEGVREIVWSGGSLADEHYDEFTFSSFVAGDGGKDGVMYFPVTQLCDKAQAAWTETPSAGQTSRDLKFPAPALRFAQAGTVAQAQGSAAQGDTVKLGSVTIVAPWTRATPAGAKVAGGYLKVTNNGAVADRLVSATSDIAGRMEIHEMSMKGGVMQMRPLDAGLEVKPGETVELKPGGLHLMFMDIKRQLKEGDTVITTLTFEKAGKVDVTFKAGSIGGASAPSSHQHHH